MTDYVIQSVSQSSPKGAQSYQSQLGAADFQFLNEIEPQEGSQPGRSLGGVTQIFNSLAVSSGASYFRKV